VKICFLMERGDPPRMNSIFAEVFERLERQGIEVLVRFPENEIFRLDRLTVEADLYCLKSDTELALSLATGLERIGARIINSVDATLLAKDKVSAAFVLARAAIPAPRSIATRRPSDLKTELNAGPLILKAHRGYHGAGINIVNGPADLPDDSEYPEYVFAQDYLAGAGNDLKIYGIGEGVFGVRKPFSSNSFLRSGEPAWLSEEVINISRRCGAAFGLELYGLDLAEDDHGAYVVDVNYFPGYRGVPNAAELLTDHLMRASKN
jgi:ribosomal protein S6--L-glutamate ligase